MTSDDGEQAERTMPRRQFLVGAGAAAGALAVGTGDALAQTDGWTDGKSGLDFSSQYVPGAYFSETLTKEKHLMAWGVDDDALAAYEDDSGNKATLAGHVDRSDTENVVTLRADKLDVPDFYAFPRGEQYDESGDGDANTNVYALDPTHWTTTDATNGTISLGTGDTHVDHSLRVSTSSIASGETVSAEFTDVSVTSDPEKRFLQGVVNVDQLTSGAVVTLAFVDGDGDRKELTFDPSGDASTDGVVATSTGNGVVFQQRAGDLSTVANGDGSWDGTEKVVLEVSEADADVTFTALNAEKMTTWSFGSYLNNEDTDDETRVERTRPSGEFTVTGLDTVSDALADDAAVFYDVQVPMRYPLAESTERFRYQIEEATERPNYDYKATLEGDVVIRNAYDLSHASPSFQAEVSMPSSRYLNVETASGVEDVAFGDVGDSSWSDHTSAFDSEGATVTFADAVQPGTVHRVSFTVLWTSDNESAATSSSGGGAIVDGNSKSDGGPMGWIFGLFAGVTGFFGIRKYFG